MSITKRLFSGTIQLTVSSALVRLVSIATVPILTSLLAPSAYGVAALVTTAIGLIAVLALSGIEMSYARSYFNATPPSGEDVELFCWRFAILAAASAAVLSGFAWSIVTKGSPELDQSLAIPLAIGVLVAVAHMMAMTRARLAGQYRLIAWSIICSGIVAAATGIAIAALWRRDAVALVVPLLLSNVIPVLILGTPSWSRLIRPSKLSRADRVALIKIGIGGLVTAPMYWMLSSADRWFLQAFRGADEVGIYSVGSNFAFLGVMLNTAIITVWLPEASREYEEDRELAKETLGRLMSRFIAGMGLVWLATAAAGGDVVRLLTNERFHEAAAVVPYVSGGVFFYGVSQLALYGLLLVRQLKWAALWWFVGGIACLILNWFLVPGYGIVGAAVTQSIAFAFVAGAILLTSQQMYRINLKWGRLFASIAIILGSAVFITAPWHVSPLASIGLKLPVGIAISCMVALVIAPDWTTRAWRMVKKAVRR